MMRAMTSTTSPQNGGHVRRLVDTLFGWIAEPRAIRLLCFLAYAILFCGAMVAAFDPPSTIEGAVGSFFMWLIAASLGTGSIMAGAAVLPGWWWLERAGLASLFVGGGAYAVVVISLSLSETDDLNRGLQLVFILVGTIALLIRALSIRGLDLDPKV